MLSSQYPEDWDRGIVGSRTGLGCRAKPCLHENKAQTQISKSYELAPSSLGRRSVKQELKHSGREGRESQSWSVSALRNNSLMIQKPQVWGGRIYRCNQLQGSRWASSLLRRLQEMRGSHCLGGLQKRCYRGVPSLSDFGVDLDGNFPTATSANQQ